VQNLEKPRYSLYELTNTAQRVQIPKDSILSRPLEGRLKSHLDHINDVNFLQNQG